MVRSRTVKAGLLAVGRALITVVNLIAAAVLARILDLGDYATYRQTFLAYHFVAPLLILGLPTALFYFLPGEKKRPLGVTVENLMTLGCMGLAFAAFLSFGGNELLARRFNNPDLTHTLKLLAPYPLFVLPAASFTACMMARDRAVSATVFNVFSNAVILAGVVSACLYWRTPTGAVMGMVVTASVMSLFAIGIMLYTTRGGSWIPTSSGIRRQLAYSVPLGLASMVSALNINLDKVIVSSLCSAEDFAIYVNGAMQIPLIAILTGSATAVLIPEMTQMFKDGRITECHDLWKRAAQKTALGIMPAMVLLFILAPDVMTVLYSDRYVDSAVPFRIYLLMLPIRIAHWGAIFLSIGRSSVILWRAVFGLGLNFALSVFLVQKVGYLGATMATVIVVYVWGLSFTYYWAPRLTGWSVRKMLPYRKLAVIFLLSMTAGLPVMILVAYGEMGPLLRLVTGGALYFAVLVPLYEITHCIRIREIISTLRQRLLR